MDWNKTRGRYLDKKRRYSAYELGRANGNVLYTSFDEKGRLLRKYGYASEEAFNRKWVRG